MADNDELSAPKLHQMLTVAFPEVKVSQLKHCKEGTERARLGG